MFRTELTALSGVCNNASPASGLDKQPARAVEVPRV